MCLPRPYLSAPAIGFRWAVERRPPDVLVASGPGPRGRIPPTGRKVPKEKRETNGGSWGWCWIGCQEGAGGVSVVCNPACERWGSGGCPPTGSWGVHTCRDQSY